MLKNFLRSSILMPILTMYVALNYSTSHQQLNSTRVQLVCTETKLCNIVRVILRLLNCCILDSRPAKFVFVLLKCSRKVLADRLQHREGHFFNSSLLQSQLDTFQEPLENDFDLIIDGTRTVNEIVDLIVSVL